MEASIITLILVGATALIGVAFVVGAFVGYGWGRDDEDERWREEMAKGGPA